MTPDRDNAVDRKADKLNEFKTEQITISNKHTRIFTANLCASVFAGTQGALVADRARYCFLMHKF
jgi:hypothetical protein